MQAQRFHRPAYSETDTTLGGFGLSYNARNASDTRSELGARFDQALPLASMAVLALHARAAWAHDWVSDPTLMPVFQALPGASFIVNGATPVPNSALASAGGELRFLNGWALSGPSTASSRAAPRPTPEQVPCVTFGDCGADNLFGAAPAADASANW